MIVFTTCVNYTHDTAVRTLLAWREVREDRTFHAPTVMRLFGVSHGFIPVVHGRVNFFNEVKEK